MIEKSITINDEKRTIILKKMPKLSTTNIPADEEVLKANEGASNLPNTRKTVTKIPAIEMRGRICLLRGEIRSTSNIKTKVAAIAISG
jgi:hypothetical protein